MKEYKVEYIKQCMVSERHAKKLENILNEMTGQGWEFRFQTSLYWIFEREK